MKLSRTTWTWIIVIAIILIIAAVVIYLFRCSIFSNLTSCVEDPNTTNIPTPPGSPTSKWVDATPPYNLGMWGTKIKALQAALGFTGPALDGKLGPVTRNAIIAKGYAFPLSQLDYDKIVGAGSGSGSGGGTPPSDPGNVVGKKVYADKITNIRSTPDVNDGWINNKVCELPANYEPAPVILEVKDCSKAGTGCVKINPYYWYKIQFKIANCSAGTGWVRQDVVTVK